MFVFLCYFQNQWRCLGFILYIQFGTLYHSTRSHIAEDTSLPYKTTSYRGEEIKAFTLMSVTVQQVANLYSFYSLQTCSTCFGWYPHPTSGARVNCNYSIWHWSNRTLPSAVAEEPGLRSDSSPTEECSARFDQCQMLWLEFTRAPDDGWRYHPKYIEQFAGNRKCTKSHLVGQLLTLIHDARTHEHKMRLL
jgi:hypothetical protein